MFRRRVPRSFLERFRNLLWPRAGWPRTGQYLWHRIARLPGSPSDLAAGFACGAAMSMTPFVGLHFVLSLMLAYALRCNLVASAIGTALGNPWTFPFIWLGTFQLGEWMVGADFAQRPENLQFAAFFERLFGAVIRGDFQQVLDAFLPILAPMILGSIPLGLVVWFATYWLFRGMIGGYQARRAKRVKDRHRPDGDMRTDRGAA